MAGADGLADWLDREPGAPEIARLGAARLTKPRIAMLGTLRRDRSPRISPIEPCIVSGRLLPGATAWSALLTAALVAIGLAIPCPGTLRPRLRPPTLSALWSGLAVVV